MRCPGQLSRLLGRRELSKENTDPYLNSSADLLKCLNESCNETAVTSLCVEKFVYRQTALSAVLLSVAWSSSSVGGRARHGWPRPAAAPLTGRPQTLSCRRVQAPPHGPSGLRPGQDPAFAAFGCRMPLSLLSVQGRRAVVPLQECSVAQSYPRGEVNKVVCLFLV